MTADWSESKEKLSTIHTSLLMRNETNKFSRYLVDKKVFGTEVGFHGFLKQTVYRDTQYCWKKTIDKADLIIKLFKDYINDKR